MSVYMTGAVLAVAWNARAALSGQAAGYVGGVLQHSSAIIDLHMSMRNVVAMWAGLWYTKVIHL